MRSASSGVTGFDAWDARSYLQDYYRRVEADEAATLAFITRACRRIAAPARALAFGVGPTVHHLLPLAPYTRELHVADYLESNLDHVRSWLRSDPQAHDWRPFSRFVLTCEGVQEPDAARIAERERMVRDRVTRCLHCDAGMDPPLATPLPGRYDVLISCFCAESATGSLEVWRRYVRNILSLLAPGGLFLTAALRRCHSYRVGPLRFACADIDEHDLAEVLIGCGVERSQVDIEVRQVGLRDRLGYDGILLAAARMPAPARAVPAEPRSADS